MNDTPTTPMDAGLREMVRAHLWYGAAGLVTGLIAAVIAIQFGPRFLSASPLFTTVALALVGTIAVSMLGGLMTFVPALATAPEND